MKKLALILLTLLPCTGATLLADVSPRPITPPINSDDLLLFHFTDEEGCMQFIPLSEMDLEGRHSILADSVGIPSPLYERLESEPMDGSLTWVFDLDEVASLSNDRGYDPGNDPFADAEPPPSFSYATVAGLLAFSLFCALPLLMRTVR